MGKAADPGGIPSGVIKAHLETQVDLLHNLFSKIWEEGKVPDEWNLDSILGGFAHYHRFQSSSRDDDIIDHLNHIYTVILLIIFAIFVSGKQYVGNPIECFSEDMEFGYSKREYARTFCWLKNTYKVGADSPLPLLKEDRKKAEIPYYQWVPVVLLVLAVLFKLPNMLWRATSHGCGLDVTQLSTLVNESRLMEPEKARNVLQQLAGHVDRWLSSNHVHHPTPQTRCERLATSRFCGLFYWGKSHGNYLTSLYLLTKLLFLGNSIGVLILLWHVLGSWYVDFGVKLLYGTYGATSTTASISSGSETDENGFAWPDLPYFPKLTFCDFNIRHQTNINTHTMQCALPINMFNEKIFGFLWFWITFVTLANFASFSFWLLKLKFGSLHGRHIQHLLENHGDLITDYDRHLALTFGNKYLRRDGCFLIQVLQRNSNALVTGDLLAQLFGIYRSKTFVKKDKGCGDIMYI